MHQLEGNTVVACIRKDSTNWEVPFDRQAGSGKAGPCSIPPYSTWVPSCPCCSQTWSS